MIVVCVFRVVPQDSLAVGAAVNVDALQIAVREVEEVQARDAVRLKGAGKGLQPVLVEPGKHPGRGPRAHVGAARLEVLAHALVDPLCGRRRETEKKEGKKRNMRGLRFKRLA